MMKPIFHFKMFQILKKRKRNKIFKDKQKVNAKIYDLFSRIFSLTSQQTVDSR